jgi:hypothetical protein
MSSAFIGDCDNTGMLGPTLSMPGPDNDWQGDHVARLLAAFTRATGRDLAAEMGLDAARLGQSAWGGDFALLSHRGDASATLNYGNRFALGLWELDWAAFTATPSAATAPEGDVAERSAVMDAVAARGYVGQYAGKRISATGRLFIIENAAIWRLVDDSGEPFGVAATFRTVRYL